MRSGTNEFGPVPREIANVCENPAPSPEFTAPQPEFFIAQEEGPTDQDEEYNTGFGRKKTGNCETDDSDVKGIRKMRSRLIGMFGAAAVAATVLLSNVSPASVVYPNQTQKDAALLNEKTVLINDESMEPFDGMEWEMSEEKPVNDMPQTTENSDEPEVVEEPEESAPVPHTCMECNGHGFICPGSAENDDPEGCHGEMYVTCKACKQTGRNSDGSPCSWCKGTLTHLCPSWEFHYECPNCGGKGEV